MFVNRANSERPRCDTAVFTVLWLQWVWSGHQPGRTNHTTTDRPRPPLLCNNAHLDSTESSFWCTSLSLLVLESSQAPSAGDLLRVVWVGTRRVDTAQRRTAQQQWRRRSGEYSAGARRQRQQLLLSSVDHSLHVSLTGAHMSCVLLLAREDRTRPQQHSISKFLPTQPSTRKPDPSSLWNETVERPSSTRRFGHRREGWKQTRGGWDGWKSLLHKARYLKLRRLGVCGRQRALWGCTEYDGGTRTPSFCGFQACAGA